MTVNTHAPTLRTALLPRGGLLTDALLVCAGAGLIAGSAQLSVKLPFTPVPITGQTFSVLLVGASGGYLVSYPFVSALTGYLAERRWDRSFSSAVGAMLTGNVLIYLVGLPWLAVVLNTNLEQTLEDGLYPFIPGDTFKLYLAAAALPAAWRLARRRKG